MELKMEDEKLSQLTAREFYPKWTSQGELIHPTKFEEWLEFAEAYAAHFLETYGKVHLDMLNERNYLLRRAAELLRPIGAFLSEDEPGKWRKERDQWLKDAGMEGK
jgi:hypothetical protein